MSENLERSHLEMEISDLVNVTIDSLEKKMDATVAGLSDQNLIQVSCYCMYLMGYKVAEKVEANEDHIKDLYLKNLARLWKQIDHNETKDFLKLVKK